VTGPKFQDAVAGPLGVMIVAGSEYRRSSRGSLVNM
jgi:hypothetical protein